MPGERLHPDDEKELRFCSRARSASMPGALLRTVLAELDAVRAERDQALARANEMPGLTAALDEARSERDANVLARVLDDLRTEHARLTANLMAYWAQFGCVSGDESKFRAAAYALVEAECRAIPDMDVLEIGDGHCSAQAINGEDWESEQGPTLLAAVDALRTKKAAPNG